MFVFRLVIHVFSFITRLIVIGRRDTPRNIPDKIFGPLKVKVDVRAEVEKWTVVISIIKTRLISGWRYRQAPPGCMFRGSICRFLRLGGRVLLFKRRVVRREGGKEKVLLIGGKVKTLLVEGIVVSHGGEVVDIRTVVYWIVGKNFVDDRKRIMTELTRLVASSVLNTSTSHQLGIQLPASTQSLVFCDETPRLTDVEVNR